MMSRQPPPKAKILVIDDQVDNIELLSIMLTMRGYEVEKNSDGRLAVEIARLKSPDLILLDVCMPEISGFEVCQELKSSKDTQNIPIIFLTALTQADSKTIAFEYGADDYITKPFQIEEVLVRIKKQLGISQSRQELIEKNVRLEQENRQHRLAQENLFRLNQRLDRLATTDGLTQIANRRYFDDFLVREWRRGRREKFPLSLIICDIDHFKQYNDFFGHQSGDICLQKVAKTISNTAKRPGDLVARYGGEEFVVLLPRTPGRNALQVAETIRDNIEKLKISHPQSSVSNHVSLSLGISCVVPDPRYTRNQLLVTADKALYAAKKQGRDRAILKSLDDD